MAITKEMRQQVRERAKFLCEYCHSSEEASAARFEIDHIQPRSPRGADTFENLALACQRCNSYRYNFTVRGKTPIGRATCDRLDLNDQEHNERAIVKARHLQTACFVF